jgi:LysR family pca operon transcriptional activator
MEIIERSRLDARVKLRHVRCFIEVARARSLARAAQALGLSQPAVSKTLAELEGIVGARLLVRSRKGAELTPAGALALPGFAASLAEIERGMEALRGAGGAVEARVRVGVLPTVAAHVAPRAVARFMADMPGAVVALTTGPNLYLLELLREGRLDMVVGRLGAPEAMTGLTFQHLYSEAVRFVVRPGHPLLAGPFDARRLADFALIAPGPDAVIRPAVDRLLIALGAGRPRARVETVSNAFGRAFVREADAVWIISEGVVARDLADGALAVLDIDTHDTLGPVGLTVRAETEPSDAARMFQRAVRMAAAG